jgi:hypothetical protein
VNFLRCNHQGIFRLNSMNQTLNADAVASCTV